VPGRRRRLKLVASNIAEERAAFATCSPPVRVRRHSGWLQIADDSNTLRGASLFGGTVRVRGVSATFGVMIRFSGERTATIATPPGS
jgi:hypothetical protein